jgi:hypothetical protein
MVGRKSHSYAVDVLNVWSSRGWLIVSNTTKSNSIRMEMKLRNHSQILNLQSLCMTVLSYLQLNSLKIILVSIGYCLLAGES